LLGTKAQTARCHKKRRGDPVHLQKNNNLEEERKKKGKKEKKVETRGKKSLILWQPPVLQKTLIDSKKKKGVLNHFASGQRTSIQKAGKKKKRSFGFTKPGNSRSPPS